MKKIDDQDFQKLCFNAVMEWGHVFQQDMIIEECSELIKALCKFKRGKIREGKVVEECIDVYLMLGQAFVMFGGQRLWEKYYDEKVQRLRDLLQEAKKNGGV